MNKTRIHLIVKGLVQGVSFRAFTQKEATRLGLTGWVKNCKDGSVEIIAEGEKKNIDDFIRWCRHGPSRAKVQSVDLKKEEVKNEEGDFSIQY